MDAELAALTTVAATTIVKLLATQAWQATRDGVAGLWHKVHPDKASRVARDLHEGRDQLLQASGQGDSTAVEAALTDEWRGRLTTLVTLTPALAADLHELLDTQLKPALDETRPRTAESIQLSATASDHSTVIQAGHSVTISESMNHDRG